MKYEARVYIKISNAREILNLHLLNVAIRSKVKNICELLELVLLLELPMIILILLFKGIPKSKLDNPL